MLMSFEMTDQPKPVARFATDGSFPQLRGGDRGLRAVNLALRKAIVADQRAFEPRASLRLPGEAPSGAWCAWYTGAQGRRLRLRDSG